MPTALQRIHRQGVYAQRNPFVGVAKNAGNAASSLPNTQGAALPVLTTASDAAGRQATAGSLPVTSAYTGQAHIIDQIMLSGASNPAQSPNTAIQLDIVSPQAVVHGSIQLYIPTSATGTASVDACRVWKELNIPLPIDHYLFAWQHTGGASGAILPTVVGHTVSAQDARKNNHSNYFVQSHRPTAAPGLTTLVAAQTGRSILIERILIQGFADAAVATAWLQLQDGSANVVARWQANSANAGHILDVNSKCKIALGTGESLDVQVGAGFVEQARITVIGRYVVDHKTDDPTGTP